MMKLGFAKLGITWETSGETIRVPSVQGLKVVPTMGGQIPKIDDAPWPGFPADIISIALVVATQAEGTVLIHEKMFESRMFYVDKLIGMGAKIILCDPHRAVVTGPSRLARLRARLPRRARRHGHADRRDVRAGQELHPERLPDRARLREPHPEAAVARGAYLAQRRVRAVKNLRPAPDTRGPAVEEARHHAGHDGCADRGASRIRPNPWRAARGSKAPGGGARASGAGHLVCEKQPELEREIHRISGFAAGAPLWIAWRKKTALRAQGPSGSGDRLPGTFREGGARSRPCRGTGGLQGVRDRCDLVRPAFRGTQKRVGYLT